jgi:hypothetical protein
MTTHEEISKRAREIWEREGRPEGRDKEHWLQAEAELRQESLQTQSGSNITSQDNAMLKVPADLNSSSSKEEPGRKRSVRRGK